MRINKKNLKSAGFVSDIFSLLSSRTRLLIVCFLLDGKKNVSEIMNCIGTTKGNISQHLNLLERSKVLISEKIANKVYYEIADSKIKKLISYVKKLYCAEIRFNK
jgi:ArsR family transcriptional regulator